MFLIPKQNLTSSLELVTSIKMKRKNNTIKYTISIRQVSITHFFNFDIITPALA